MKFEVPAADLRWPSTGCAITVASAPEPAKDGGRDLAYALYVLARNGAAPVGDLRYYRRHKLSDFATPIAKAQIAAALSMLGDKARADKAYIASLDAICAAAQARTRPRRLRLGLARLRGAGDAGVGKPRGAKAPSTARLLRIDAARALSNATSTQEDAWLVLAARALAKQTNAIALNVARQAAGRALSQSAAACARSPVAVVNKGDGNVQAVVSVSAARR